MYNDNYAYIVILLLLFYGMVFQFSIIFHLKSRFLKLCCSKFKLNTDGGHIENWNVILTIMLWERMRKSELRLCGLCSSVSLADARFTFSAQFWTCEPTEIVDGRMFNRDIWRKNFISYAVVWCLVVWRFLLRSWWHVSLCRKYFGRKRHSDDSPVRLPTSSTALWWSLSENGSTGLR